MATTVAAPELAELRIQTWAVQRVVVLLATAPVPILTVVIGVILDGNGVHVLPACIGIALVLLVVCAWTLRDVVPTRVICWPSEIEIRQPFRAAVKRPTTDICWRYQSWPPLRYMLRGSLLRRDVTICLMEKDGTPIFDGQNKFSTRALTALAKFLMEHQVERRPDLLGPRL